MEGLTSTRLGEAIGALEAPDRISGGSPTMPIHITHHTAHETERARENYIAGDLPFTGRYGTYLKGKRLFIPAAYHRLVGSGGVITVGLDKSLWLFGKIHWSRMSDIISQQVGIDARRNLVARNFYGRALQFDALGSDGAVELTDDLIRYAGLSDKATLVGLIYFAEVIEDEADARLSADQMHDLVHSIT